MEFMLHFLPIIHKVQVLGYFLMIENEASLKVRKKKKMKETKRMMGRMLVAPGITRGFKKRTVTRTVASWTYATVYLIRRTLYSSVIKSGLTPSPRVVQI